MSSTMVEVESVGSQSVVGQEKTARFLMCAPKLYEVDYVINPWMAGNVHGSSQARAMAQWERLYAAVSDVATIELVEPVAGWPDMVFTANAGLACGRSVAISSFYHPERQGEEPYFRQWFMDAGFSVLDVNRETPFEGEGDALFAVDEAGERLSRLWAGYGPRTAAASHETLRRAWHVEVVGLHLVDPRFYHLDTCFAPLVGGYAMYYPAAFDAASVALIEAFYPVEKRVVLGEADAVRFACNVVTVDRTVILNRVSDSLAEQLAELGFEVVQVELGEFMKAGGAAKCLVMRLP